MFNIVAVLATLAFAQANSPNSFGTEGYGAAYEAASRGSATRASSPPSPNSTSKAGVCVSDLHYGLAGFGARDLGQEAAIRVLSQDATYCPRDLQTCHTATSLSYTPAKLGVEVRGVNLNNDLAQDVVDQMKQAVHEHRLLIFKDQGVVTGERQVEITKLFGEIKSSFESHPASPHPDVFTASNNNTHGHTDVGIYGWHIDGWFEREPHEIVVYHMVSVPRTGSTAFIGFDEVLNTLTDAQRSRWEQLWMVGNQGTSIHPLVYTHAVTKKAVMCLHLGFIEKFVWNYKSKHQMVTGAKETQALLQEIHDAFVQHDEALVYKHSWESGDFIISDNRAVAHRAAPESQLPVAEVGLRVLHRVTVAGKVQPKK